MLGLKEEVKYSLSAGRRQKKKSRRSAGNHHAIIIYRGGFEQIRAAALLYPQRNDDHTLKITAALGGSRREARTAST